MFKGDVLEFVLQTAASRDTQEEPITLEEIATSLEERFGYDLEAVKKAPVILDSRYGEYCHDQPELFAQGGELNLAFSHAYWVIHAYTHGGSGQVFGGTGLPD